MIVSCGHKVTWLACSCGSCLWCCKCAPYPTVVKVGHDRAARGVVVPLVSRENAST